jgi:hypothetical protein
MASDLTYATAYDVEEGFRALTSEEQTRAEALLQEAAIIINAYNQSASEDAKRLVSCRMVRRQLGAGDGGDIQFPMGSTQGSMSAMGYSQSWTMGSGSVGELYLSKLDKKLLGVGNRIGAHSPLEGMTNAGD